MIKFLQRGAVRVARLAPGKAHAVGVVGELLGIAVIAGVAGELVKGIVGVGVRQLAVGLAGQHLLHHGAVLIVGIGDLVLPVGHGGELVALVVAHLECDSLCFLALAMQGRNDLLSHVPGLVIGILLAIARGLQEAGKLAQRVIGIGALGSLAVFSANLTRDVAVLVVAVAEGDVACAAGCLGEQIANAVIAVCRCQGAGFGHLVRIL